MANAWREYRDKVAQFPYKEVLQQRREAGEVDLTLSKLIHEEAIRQREEVLRKKGMTWEEYLASKEYLDALQKSARARISPPELRLNVGEEWKQWGGSLQK